MPGCRIRNALLARRGRLARRLDQERHAGGGRDRPWPMAGRDRGRRSALRCARAMARHVGVRDPQSAAVATAILIGDRGSLDGEVERRLQEAGTYHVIAISGGNIAILAGLILGALWWLRIRDGWAAGAAVALLAWYAYVAGGGASVTRATVMAAIYLSLRVIDQRTAPSHAPGAHRRHSAGGDTAGGGRCWLLAHLWGNRRDSGRDGSLEHRHSSPKPRSKPQVSGPRPFFVPPWCWSSVCRGGADADWRAGVSDG